MAFAPLGAVVIQWVPRLTLVELQSRSGDKPLKFRAVLPENGTAVLKWLGEVRYVYGPKALLFSLALSALSTARNIPGAGTRYSNTAFQERLCTAESCRRS